MPSKLPARSSHASSMPPRVMCTAPCCGRDDPFFRRFAQHGAYPRMGILHVIYRIIHTLTFHDFQVKVKRAVAFSGKKHEPGRIRADFVDHVRQSDELAGTGGRSKRFMPHFHIPLQSGSDEVLKLKTCIRDRTIISPNRSVWKS